MFTPLRSASALNVTLCSLALTLMVGCVSVPKVDVDKAAAGQMKRIALLKVGEPQDVAVINMGGAAMGFGIIGALVQGDVNAGHTQQFVDVVRKMNPTLSAALTASLKSALTGDGFVVSFSEKKPKPTADKKDLDYSGVNVDADAILNVWYGVMGYMSSANSLHYVPWVSVRAQLVDAKTKKVLYFKTFQVGFNLKLKNAVDIDADRNFRYKSFDDLMAHSKEAAANLVTCQDLVVQQVAEDLKAQ